MLIFLIGFMGSGKSYWGPQWATSLNMDFADLDKMVEARAGISISQIFDELGEEAFRVLEQKVLKELAGRENLVVACGGGTPCHHNNMDWMLANGKTVYLSATPRQLFDRIRHELEGRPLLKSLNEGEILYFIEKTLASRIPFYSRADVNLNIQELDLTSLDNLCK